MKYKKIKIQKQKNLHSISPDLILKNRFEEIVTILNKKTALKNSERYLYGYSLLRTNKKLESLITLWPLVAKGHTALEKDCTTIAADVFNDAKLLSADHLSYEALQTLFMAARSLVPESHAYSLLKQRYFNSLWQGKEYEKLERIIKSHKKEFSGIYVENLSKLAFFQAQNKLTGNIPAFVSYILTGGACLIARNVEYHRDIADAMQLLANELKLLFSQLQHKQKLAWDQSLFDNFVDYETTILIHILQLSVKANELPLDIIPTPNYLFIYDGATHRVSQSFLPWVSSQNKELLELYNADVHRGILWALGEEKSHDIKHILTLVRQQTIHPYLRLVFMLRAAQLNKASLKEVVQIREFKQLKESSQLFKSIAIQIIKSMINAESEMSSDFLTILLEFYPVLQDPDLQNSILMHLLNKIHRDHGCRRSLNLIPLKKIAHQVNATELEKEIDKLWQRQQVCLEFLLSINSEKKSKKIISAIKNESMLRIHLALIADACYLTFTKLPGGFFQQIQSLVTNKKINTLLPLKKIFNFEFTCPCPACEEELYFQVIPTSIEQLNLPVARLPARDFYSQLIPKTSSLKSSILSQPDPFKMIDVSLTDSKQIILQKIMKLIQHSPEKMSIFRQAQNELFRPAQRFLHHYFRFIAYEKYSAPVTLPLQDIPFRQEFLNAN